LSEKYNCFIHYYPPFLDEETRLQKVFLDSKICLGFNSDHAVENGMPTERVFEGVAYGCVVLTDCPMAVEATDGAAVLVTNYAELEEKVEYYLNNDNARLEKQKQGMEFAKSKGTYYSVVGDFLKTIHEIYKEKK
jgi:spore maturation protein CgeB